MRTLNLLSHTRLPKFSASARSTLMLQIHCAEHPAIFQKHPEAWHPVSKTSRLPSPVTGPHHPLHYSDPAFARPLVKFSIMGGPGDKGLLLRLPGDCKSIQQRETLRLNVDYPGRCIAESE